MVKILNNINNTIGASNAGVTNTLTIQNPDNSNAASHAQSLLTVGGTSGGNPWQQWTVGTTRSYSMGITNTTAEESLRINTNNSASVSPITGTNLWNMRTSGVRTMPLQPAFQVWATSAQTNVTGDGTPYVIQYATEIGDQGSNFSTPNFTAPVTGIYFFCSTLAMTGLGPAHTFMRSRIIINGDENSGVAYAESNPHAISYATSSAFSGSVVYPLNAGDQISVYFQVNNGAKTVSLTIDNSFFSGFLIA